MSEHSNPTPSLRIGFVGVGRMGSAMVRCVLEAGFRATLCDHSEQSTAPFVARYPEQARVARTPREAAAGADVIELAVNTNEQLLDACLGADGVIAGAAKGSSVLIHSTVSHATLQRLVDAANGCGVHVLDVMVAGARGHMSAGDLAVMAGGDADAFARAKPVMDTYGGLVLHLGPSGAGLDAKLALNMFRYVVMAASDEAARLATKAGVGEALAQLVAHAEANRFTGSSERMRGLASYPPTAREKDAVLAQKDLRAAMARAAELDLELPSAALTVGLMHRVWGVEPSAK